MLTPEQQDILTRVGPGTPMGALLRRYWLAVAASVEIPSGGARPLRVLGEDLALFRTTGGELGVVDSRCPHRGASLAYGFADDEAIQCPYHGWRFDPTGQCVEVTSFTRSDHFRAAATTTAYRAQELGGLVFVYLGPDPAPCLPRYDLFAWEGVLRYVGKATIPCNWLQIMENSVDPVHLEHLHGRHLSEVRTRDGEPAPRRYGRRHAEIDFDVFEHGIVKRRVLEGGSREDDDWKIGHPLVFPLMVRVGAGRQHRFQIRTPVDDTTTLHFWYSCYLPGDGDDPIVQDEIPVYDVPFADERGYILDFVDGGDIMTWVTQGPIADRTRELLTDTDRGVVLLRRLLFQQLERIQAGEDPLGVVRPPHGDAVIELPQEVHKYGDGDAFLEETIAASHVRHSPLRERIAELIGRPPGS